MLQCVACSLALPRLSHARSEFPTKILRCETSPAGSQPQSWSDVTLLEDISQEASSRPLPARLDEVLGSSSESLGEEASPTNQASIRASHNSDPCTGNLRSQKVQGPQPKSGARPADRPCLRYNTTQSCSWRNRTDSPVASLQCPKAQPRFACPRRPRIQETVNSIKRPKTPWKSQPGTRIVTQISYRARMPVPPSKAGLQLRFFAPSPRWCASMLGIAVPKPRPLARPPPRSLTYKPPAPPQGDRLKPLGLPTVEDLPSRQRAQPENKPRRSSTPAAPRAPAVDARGLVSRTRGLHKRLVGKRPAFSSGRRSCF